MKYIILLLTLIQPIESFGQIKEFLLKKEVNLESWIDNNTNKDKLIKDALDQGLFEEFYLDEI